MIEDADKRGESYVDRPQMQIECKELERTSRFSETCDDSPQGEGGMCQRREFV